MATLHLPENPDIDQLRRQARELQRRADPGVPLATAQLAIARRYGFASWPQLRHHVDAIRARSWTLVDGDDAAAERVVGLRC